MDLCYFCNGSNLRVSRGQRPLIFQKDKFLFLFCSDCKSYSMHPKLTERQIETLYSTDYIDKNPAIQEIETPQKSKFVNLYDYLNSLEEASRLTFLDYGCGSNPETLRFTKNKDLVSFGMELVESVRDIAAVNSGAVIFSREEVLEKRDFFDFIFLGDVLEHLIEPVTELRALRKTLKSDGVFIAQGPLQGSATLMQSIVKAFSALTPNRISDFPPYHVSLASVKSMKAMFSSAGLEIEFLQVYEVFWPAPSFNEFLKFPSPRNLLLYVSKRIDILVSAIVPNFGSVYFLVAKPTEDK